MTSYLLATNLIYQNEIQTKPARKLSQRLRLTDAELSKAWKGQVGKNKFVILLDQSRRFDTIRFKSKNKIKIKSIKLITYVNSTKVFKKKTTQIKIKKGKWFYLRGFNQQADKIKLIIQTQNKVLKIQELRIHYQGNDINQDGLGDFFIGAPLHDGEGNNRGEAYIYLGNKTGTYTPNQTLSGGVDNEELGTNFSGIGDVNGDGFNDYIIGTERYDGARGKAYLYLGNTSLNSTSEIVYAGLEMGGFFSHSIAGLGDINGDGFDDFMIGAHRNDGGGSSLGQAFLFMGGETISGVPVYTFLGDVSNARLGSAVTGIRDINHDGFDDYMISSATHQATVGGDRRGRVYVYLGSESLNTTPYMTINGTEDTAFLGRSMAGLGDINGDGFDDFLISADGADAGGTSRGQAFVFLGGDNLDSTPDLTIDGFEDFAGFGEVVCALGDVNGDGFDDFMVGSQDYSGSGNSLGQAYLYLGGTSVSTSPHLVFTGSEDYAYFGISVSGLGDINGDGFDDFMIGAEGQDGEGTNRGAVFIYYGKSTLSTVPDVTLYGNEDNSEFGNAVSGMGRIS